MSTPAQWPRTIYRGTDHDWTLRRVHPDGTPIIPDSARAQVRPRFGGDILVDASTENVTGPRIHIDEDEGWLHIIIPENATTGPEWDRQLTGVWDVEVVVDGLTYRWAMGAVTVSQDVTR